MKITMPDLVESPQLSYKNMKYDMPATKTDLDAQALKLDMKEVIQTLPVSGIRDSGEKHVSSIQTLDCKLLAAERSKPNIKQNQANSMNEDLGRHTPELVSELEETLRLKIKNVQYSIQSQE